jgi:hypothetical protein
VPVTRAIALDGQLPCTPELPAPSHQPPHDAREWACPYCGNDLLFGGHLAGCTYVAPGKVGLLTAQAAHDRAAAVFANWASTGTWWST